MNSDQARPRPEADARMLALGFTRVMATLANASNHERERLLRVADSADRAHDAYALAPKSNQQDDPTSHVLRLADAYSAIGLQRGDCDSAAAETAHTQIDSPTPAVATRRAARVRPPDDLDAIDVSLVHADDGFLDALGAAEPDPDGLFADDGLATLLLSWQQDVASEPISRLAESTLAAAAVRAARARQQRQPRLQAALAKTAAALTIMLGSVGLAARHAEPGDKLWGITRVLYTEHARSVEAAAAVRTDLREAQEALANGKVVEAKSMLEEAMHSLPAVANEEGKDHLLAQHAALQKQLPDEPTVGTSTPPNNCTTLPTR